MADHSPLRIIDVTGRERRVINNYTIYGSRFYSIRALFSYFKKQWFNKNFQEVQVIQEKSENYNPTAAPPHININSKLIQTPGTNILVASFNQKPIDPIRNPTFDNFLLRSRSQRVPNKTYPHRWYKLHGYWNDHRWPHRSSSNRNRLGRNATRKKDCRRANQQTQKVQTKEVEKEETSTPASFNSRSC